MKFRSFDFQVLITLVQLWKKKWDSNAAQPICVCSRLLFYSKQGHPMTVFYEISVRRSKYRLEYYITWGLIKISRWSFHSSFHFRSLSSKLRTIFLTLIFALYFPSYAIFRRKEEPKIFGFKNLMERGIRKCLTSVIRQISSKMFGKIIIKPL